ncbi:MAG: hypothetical protein WDN28_24715 [Chthoniobacter sp.]
MHRPPTLSTPPFLPNPSPKSLTPDSTPQITFTDALGTIQSLIPNADYTVSTDADRKAVINFTAAGAEKIKKAKNNTTLTASYVRTNGDVVVQAGARLESPTSAEHVGGRVMLVGTNVKNAGTISTPDGQTILAAGLQIGVDAHVSSDPSLRGLDVYVGAVDDASFKKSKRAGRAVNSGLVEAAHADVTMTGRHVKQLGVIESSTSISLNGRIDLLANYDAITNTGYDATKPENGLHLRCSPPAR